MSVPFAATFSDCVSTRFTFETQFVICSAGIRCFIVGKLQNKKYIRMISGFFVCLYVWFLVVVFLCVKRLHLLLIIWHFQRQN